MENQKKITKEKEFFRENILYERFNFMDKWKLFSAFETIYEELKEKKYSELRGNIHNFIGIRNKFAHGKVRFKEGKDLILVYYQKGEKEDIITEDYIENIYKLTDVIVHELIQLMVFTKK